MSFLKTIKKVAGYTPFTGFGALTGNGLVGAATNALITGPRQAQNEAANQLYQGYEGAKQGASSAYTKAGEQLTGGMGTAADTARTGFQKATDTAKTGYEAAKSAYGQAGQEAVGTAKEGFKQAQGMYETPEMVTSRQELYNRVLGKGGLQPDVVNQMEGKAREEYGTSLRDVQRGLSQFAGESQAGGLAGENYARAASQLGANRANTIRDIETQNAQLARQEQTGAISALGEEAYRRAGLSADEAKTVSDLQEKLASGTAALSAQETNALTQLAQAEGTTLSELQQRLATGQAGLTTEEAKLLAELTSAQATGQFTAASQPSMLEKLAPSLIQAGATLLA
jgi:hypothetical protein